MLGGGEAVGDGNTLAPNTEHLLSAIHSGSLPSAILAASRL